MGNSPPPEVSQLSNEGAVQLADFLVPGLTTRRAETTVELGSGQSFAIAGLFLDNARHDIDSVPGLVDIPILGTLFRSDRFERNETDLVILVTPYLVRPFDAALGQVPSDPYRDVGMATATPRVNQSSRPLALPVPDRGRTGGGVAAAPIFILE